MPDAPPMPQWLVEGCKLAERFMQHGYSPLGIAAAAYLAGWEAATTALAGTHPDVPAPEERSEEKRKYATGGVVEPGQLVILRESDGCFIPSSAQRTSDWETVEDTGYATTPDGTHPDVPAPGRSGEEKP